MTSAMRPGWASRSFAAWAIMRSLLARRARPSEERTQWRCRPRSSAFFPADVVQQEISMLDVQLSVMAFGTIGKGQIGARGLVTATVPPG